MFAAAGDFDSWIQLLANVGGMGLLAGALFVLHRDAIRAFTEQLNLERKTSEDLWRTYMDLKVRQHEQVMSTLMTQDRALTQIMGRLGGNGGGKKD